MNKKEYLLRSYLIANLVKEGIILYYDNDQADNTLEINSWLHLSWGLGRLQLENVIDGLSKLKNLHAKLNQDISKIEMANPNEEELTKEPSGVVNLNENKLKLEWNYLGNSVDRENYLLEVSKFFWQNQNEEVILGHSQFINWMEEPWQIINFAEDFAEDFSEDFANNFAGGNGLNFPLAANYFSSNSLNLFDTLEKNLELGIFQPYLIISPQASFQFKISLQGKIVLSGVIIPAGDVAYLEIYL